MSEDDANSNPELSQKTEDAVAEKVLKRTAEKYLQEWQDAKEVLKKAQQDCALKEKR